MKKMGEGRVNGSHKEGWVNGNHINDDGSGKRRVLHPNGEEWRRGHGVKATTDSDGARAGGWGWQRGSG